MIPDNAEHAENLNQTEEMSKIPVRNSGGKIYLYIHVDWKRPRVFIVSSIM